jgi:hypothetical protein
MFERREQREYDPSRPRISSATRNEIQQLAPVARRYRSGANPSGEYAVANERLTRICRDLYVSGVAIRELAAAANVTYKAMERRVKAE